MLVWLADRASHFAGMWGGGGGGGQKQKRYAHTFLTYFFVLAMLIGTIDFWCFMPLSVTLTLAGVTRSLESKTDGHNFRVHFSTNQDEI